MGLARLVPKYKSPYFPKKQVVIKIVVAYYNLFDYHYDRRNSILIGVSMKAENLDLKELSVYPATRILLVLPYHLKFLKTNGR